MAILQLKFDVPDIRTQSVCGRTEQFPRAHWPAAGGRRGSAGCLRQTRCGHPQCIWRTDRMNEVEGLKYGANPQLPCLAVPGAVWLAGRSECGRGRIRDVDVGVVKRGMPQ
jgi:hypothetical protein